jgi:hypothetical protein
MPRPKKDTMIMALDDKDQKRLISFLGMMGSDHQDSANAGRMADKLIKGHGLTWEEVVNGKVNGTVNGASSDAHKLAVAESRAAMLQAQVLGLNFNLMKTEAKLEKSERYRKAAEITVKYLESQIKKPEPKAGPTETPKTEQPKTEAPKTETRQRHRGASAGSGWTQAEFDYLATTYDECYDAIGHRTTNQILADAITKKFGTVRTVDAIAGALYKLRAAGRCQRR